MATNETQTPAEQPVAVKPAAQPKKKGKASNVFFTIIVIAAILGAGYYLLTNYVLAPKHEIKIDDKTITLRMSVQEFIDNGFVLCNVTGKVIEVPTTTVKAKEIVNTTYYIGIPDSKVSAKNTGIAIKPANFTSSSQKLSECTIYELSYSPKYQKGGKVLIDGEDMNTTEVDKWVSFFKAKGFPFSEKELADFGPGKDTYMSGTKDTHKYSADIDTTNKAFGTFKMTRDVKVEYKTK